MSESPQDQLGPVARLHMDAFELSVSAQGNPDAVRLAELRMSLSASRAAEELAAFVDQAPEDPQAQLRSDLRTLRCDPANEPIFELIDEELEKLPELPVEPERDLARWLLSGLVSEPEETAPAPTNAIAEHGKQEPKTGQSPEGQDPPEPAASNPDKKDGAEQLRQPLPVTVYRGDAVLMLNGDKPVPLGRELAASQTTVEAENALKTARLKVLEILAAEPTKKFPTPELWARVFGDEEPFSSRRWSYIMNSFIESLKYDGSPLITIDRHIPKRYKYQLGPYTPQLEYTDEVSGIEQNLPFETAIGGVIGGAVGRVLSRLLLATEEQPFGLEDLLAILTDEEKARIKNHSTILSSYISTARSTLRDLEADVAYSVKSTAKKTPGKRPFTEYWMEQLPYDAEKQQQLNGMYVASRYIHAHNGLLEMLGLPVLDDGIVAALSSKVPYRLQQSSADQTEAVGAESSLRYLQLIYQEDFIEERFSRDSDDRWPLVDYLFDIGANASDPKVMLFQAALTAKVVSTEQVADGIDITYDVEGHGRVVVHTPASTPPPEPGGTERKPSGDEKPASDDASPDLEKGPTTTKEQIRADAERVLAPHFETVQEILTASKITPRDNIPFHTVKQHLPSLSIDIMKSLRGNAVGIKPTDLVWHIGKLDPQFARLVRNRSDSEEVWKYIVQKLSPELTEDVA